MKLWATALTIIVPEFSPARAYRSCACLRFRFNIGIPTSPAKSDVAYLVGETLDTLPRGSHYLFRCEVPIFPPRASISISHSLEPNIDTRGVINLGHVRSGDHALSELELELIAYLTFVLRADSSLSTARVLWLCFDSSIFWYPRFVTKKVFYDLIISYFSS